VPLAILETSRVSRRVPFGDVDPFRRGRTPLHREIYGASANRTGSVYGTLWNRDHFCRSEYDFVIFEFNPNLPL
jgi:hypothetical protein